MLVFLRTFVRLIGTRKLLTAHPSEASSAPADVLSKGWLTPSQAEELITAFRIDFGNFPFVMIPHIPLERMRYEMPTLLLAMLVAAARKDSALQETLDNEFKTQICTQVIINCARTLELVQALLAYLSWYHLRFR